MNGGRELSLVEVLVAVVVCGAGLAVAASGIAAAVRAEAHAERLSRAAAHLEQLLAEVESGVLPLEDGEGVFEGEDAAAIALRWSLHVSTTDVEGLLSIQATVLWDEGGLAHDLSVERLLFVDPLLGGLR